MLGDIVGKMGPKGMKVQFSNVYVEDGDTLPPMASEMILDGYKFHVTEIEENRTLYGKKVSVTLTYFND